MRAARAEAVRGSCAGGWVVASLLLCVLVSPSAALGAELRVRGPLQCPTEKALRAALAEELSALRSVRPRARILVRSAERGALELQLQERGATLRRRTVRDAQARCDQLAEAAVLLVRIWRQELGATPTREPPKESADPRGARPAAESSAATGEARADPGAGATSSAASNARPGAQPTGDGARERSEGDAAVADGATPPVPPPPPTPPMPDAQVEVELDPEVLAIELAPGVLVPPLRVPSSVGPPTPAVPTALVAAVGGERSPPAEVTPRPETGTLGAPRPVTFAVLSGVGWYQRETAPGLMANLRADVAFTRNIAAGLQLAFDGRRSAVKEPGEVRAQALSATALARWRLRPPFEMGPTAALGAKLDRIDAWSEGYSRNGSAAVYAPGVWADVGWTQPLGARFSLVASAGVAYRFTRETFSVAQVGEVLTLPNLALSASAGVSWTIP